MLLLPIFLLSPYIILLFHSHRIGFLDWGEVWWAVKNSGVQASVSSAGCLAVGIVFALGLNRIDMVSRRLGGWARALLIMPAMLPPFFVILTVFHVIDPFPFGLGGIAVTHVFQYAGIIGVSLAGVLLQRSASLAEVSWCLGVSRARFFLKAWPVMRRDFLAHAAFTFLMCFTSFSVPLVVGGGRGTTLEVLIYEKIRLAGDIGSAVGLSALQSIAMALLIWVVPREVTMGPQRRLSNPLLSSSVGTGFIMLYLGVFLYPWLTQSWIGVGQLMSLPDVGTHLLIATGKSLLLALNVCVAVLVLLLGCTRLAPETLSFRFLRYYFPPSVALIGVAGLLVGSVLGSYVVYVIAMIALFVPMVFRFGLESILLQLEPQKQIARVLGATERQIWQSVIVPQVWPRLCFLFALVFVWSLGDFSLAKFFLPSGSTLPLLLENLMTSYRIDAAMTLGAGILCLSALVVYSSRRLARVYH